MDLQRRDQALNTIIQQIGQAYGQIRLLPKGTRLKLLSVMNIEEPSHLAYFCPDSNVWHHILVYRDSDRNLQVYHLSPTVNVQHILFEDLASVAQLSVNSVVIQIHHEEKLLPNQIVAVAFGVKVVFETVGQEYNLTEANCEQFVNFCFTLR